MEKPVNPHGSRGFKLGAPSAVETLEHLERTLDNLDPVVPSGTLDAAAVHAATAEQIAPLSDAFFATVDSVIADIVAPAPVPGNPAIVIEPKAGDPSVEAIETPVVDDGPIA